MLRCDLLLRYTPAGYPTSMVSLISSHLILSLGSSFSCRFLHISHSGICLPLHNTPSDASLPPLSCYEGQLLFWFGLRCITVLPFFHESLNTQGHINFFSFLLDSARSYLRHESSIQHRSFFRKLVSFLIAFRDEAFVERRLLHFLSGACSTSTSMLS